MNHDDAESRTDQSSEEVAACAEFASILIDAYLAQLQTPAVNLHWMCREFIENANDATRSIDFMSIILYTIFVIV